MRYVYGYYETEEKADRALDNLYADGYVSGSEWPKVFYSAHFKKWVLTLGDRPKEKGECDYE